MTARLLLLVRRQQTEAPVFCTRLSGCLHAFKCQKDGLRPLSSQLKRYSGKRDVGFMQAIIIHPSCRKVTLLLVARNDRPTCSLWQVIIMTATARDRLQRLEISSSESLAE